MIWFRADLRGRSEAVRIPQVRVSILRKQGDAHCENAATILRTNIPLMGTEHLIPLRTLDSDSV